MGEPADTRHIAGSLISDARHMAGLSQVELAARMGVTQSVISDYERGRRQPSLPTLMSLIEATGHRLATELVGSADSSRGHIAHRHARVLARHRLEVLQAAHARGARNVRVFGSTISNDDRPGSDIDLLVDLDDTTGIVALAALQSELETILGVPVDVVPAASLKPELAHVVDSAVPL